MSNNYFKNISKKYRIKGKDFTLSSTYYPPYNMKKDVGIGIPMVKEIFRSENLAECYKFIDDIKKGTRKI